MRNALFPPVSSLYSIGNSEVQVPNLDAILQTENKGSVHGDVFSVVYNTDNQLLLNGVYDTPWMCPFNYQQDHQFGSSSCDGISQQAGLLLGSNSAFLQLELEIQNMQNASKHPNAGTTDLLPLNGISGLVENKNHTMADELKKNKRRKLSAAAEPHQPYKVMGALIESREEKLQFRARKTQKLSDKITALQKLVSPYGKTDTASVLQEASLYIKLLQEQIQNLYKVLSSTYKSAAALNTQEIGCKELNLRSRGLCLVPLTFTQKVTKEEQVNHNA